MLTKTPREQLLVVGMLHALQALELYDLDDVVVLSTTGPHYSRLTLGSVYWKECEGAGS